MKNSIENTLQSCFKCQMATNAHHTEPVKMTEAPQRPWDPTEVNFCGPFYNNNNYAFVLTD